MARKKLPHPRLIFHIRGDLYERYKIFKTLEAAVDEDVRQIIWHELCIKQTRQENLYANPIAEKVWSEITND